MLARKITNKIKYLYCLNASASQNNRLGVGKKLVVTTFYDVEGDYAISDMSQPCFRALNKIAELEESLSIRSTYNVVAKFASEAPDLFRSLEKSGHEIASHSYDHQVLTSLSASECRQNIIDTRKSFDSLGLSVVGHRSPQSMWNLNVLNALYEAGFSWNAENGRDDIPFTLPVSLLHRRKTLWRLPITIDDWAYEGNDRSPEELLSSWRAAVDHKLVTGGYIAIGFHPWIEEADERFEAFSEFMRWLAMHEDIQMLPFGDVIKHVGKVEA